MAPTETPAELTLSSCVAQYVSQGNPSQAEREARAERLVRFLTHRREYTPTKYVFWWLLIAFVLGFFLAGGFQR